MDRLILLVESRIRGDVYVRFGGELPKTHRSNTAGRWMLSLPPFDRRIWNIAGNWTNTFTLSKRPNIKMEISATGTSKSIQGSDTIAPAAFIHTAIRYTFAGDKAMIQIKGNDLFNGSNHLTTKVRNGNQYLDMYLNNYMRNVTVSFSYKFGGFQKKEVKDVDLSRFKH